MRRTVDSNWSMCPLVVSEWRKSTGTNGTSTWVKSMRILGTGIVNGLPQTLCRTDQTEVQQHVRGEVSSLENVLLGISLWQDSNLCLLTFPSFVHREEPEGFIHAGQSAVADIRVHRDESYENLNGLKDYRELQSGCSAWLTWATRHSNLKTEFTFNCSRNFTAKCENCLSDWLELQCRLDFKCSLWGSISPTWAVLGEDLVDIHSSDWQNGVQKK